MFYFGGVWERRHTTTTAGGVEAFSFDTTSITSRLLKRAASVRQKIPSDFPQIDELYYPSAYIKTEKKTKIKNDNNDKLLLRGFCNWIIPGRIMVGQYPGQNPEITGPTCRRS